MRLEQTTSHLRVSIDTAEMVANVRIAMVKNGRLNSESTGHLDQVEQLLFGYSDGNRRDHVCIECCGILCNVTGESNESRSLGI